MQNSHLGTRMKEYEARNQYYLQKRTPVAIRVDGRAFHSFTKSLKRPFDNIFQTSMIETMEAMCEQIQNCIFAYTQSDEITFILKDWKELNTCAWFEYRTDKLCSISASLATYYFNKFFRENASHIIKTDADKSYCLTLERCLQRLAVFDARCFNIPKEEVTNLVYWRQLDAMRNSVLMVGQSRYSHRQLQGASCKVIKEMLRQDNYDWEKLPIYQQRGVCCYKTEDEGWYLDFKMPVLKDEGRNIIEELL